MKIVGCDLHAKQQTIAMVDTETGEFTEETLAHEGNKVREFYADAGWVLRRRMRSRSRRTTGSAREPSSSEGV